MRIGAVRLSTDERPFEHPLTPTVGSRSTSVQHQSADLCRREATSRIDDTIEWFLPGFNGVIAFDQTQAMDNFAGRHAPFRSSDHAQRVVVQIDAPVLSAIPASISQIFIAGNRSPFTEYHCGSCGDLRAIRPIARHVRRRICREPAIDPEYTLHPSARVAESWATALPPCG